MAQYLVGVVTGLWLGLLGAIIFLHGQVLDGVWATLVIAGILIVAFNAAAVAEGP